jgi:hypothetical protein
MKEGEPMKRKLLVLAGTAMMLTGIWGNAGAVYAKTIEAGEHATERDWRHEEPTERRHSSGGPGVTQNNCAYNGTYGYPGGPGTTYNNTYNNTLGYGTPTTSTGSSSTYYTGTWKQDANGYWYQFSNGTYPKNCWTVIDGSYYCFDANGYRRYGWIYWNNKWYYCGTDGALLANTYTPDGYYVGSDGVWVR